MERRQKDTGIAEVQIDDVGLLDVIDAYTCQRILGDSRCRGVVDTKAARSWVRHVLVGRGERDVAARVRAAVERAAEAGVVRLESCIAPRSRGPRAVWPFQKRTWADIEGSEAARVFLLRLGLGAESFES